MVLLASGEISRIEPMTAIVGLTLERHLDGHALRRTRDMLRGDVEDGLALGNVGRSR